MLIIPEIETVVILVPRTGSGSLRRAVAETYPKSFLLYRHMEADGIPLGYDRWHRLGVVRDPVDRLWSLYCFLQTFGLNGKHDAVYAERMRNSVKRPFSDWIVNNEIPFSTPYDSAGYNRYWPEFTCRHPIPENRKSQVIYLRPDLGTEICQYSRLPDLFARMRLPNDKRENQAASTYEAPPELTDEAREHIERWFEWDHEVANW